MLVVQGVLCASWEVCWNDNAAGSVRMRKYTSCQVSHLEKATEVFVQAKLGCLLSGDIQENCILLFIPSPSF